MDTPEKRSVIEITDIPTKQWLIMRTDTKPPMRRGKSVAQGGHGSCAFLARRIEKLLDAPLWQRIKTAVRHVLGVETFGLTPAMIVWIRGSYAKVGLQATEEELLAVKEAAEKYGLEVHLVTDSGKTEFGEPTVTCLAIGPDFVENVSRHTKHLKLW